jgi:hypothetical protein
MLIRKFWALGLLLVMVVSLCLLGNTQEAKQEEQKMMEAYMKLAAVTKNHAFFKNFVGEWDIQPHPGCSLAQSRLQPKIHPKPN